MSTKKPVKRSSKKTSATKKSYTKPKKGKVYIPAYKVIFLCVSIIAICMILLFVTTSKENASKQNEPVTSISERFEEKTNNQVSEEKPPVKTEPAKPQKKETPAPVEVKKQPEKKPEKQIQKPQEETKQSPKENKKTEEVSKENKKAPSVAEKKSTYNFPKAATSNTKLIFVFDDGGQNNAQLDKFLALPFPITVAVLPQLANSKSAADKVRKSGNEVILHQPMQSINPKVNPGPGAITPDMDEAQIISQLFININQLGPISGMNNHEGSGITADAELLAIILQVASDNGIYFLDSRTNVETKVPFVAHEMGYSYFERNIFLDNEKTKENALKELRKGLDIANKNGNAIMIGHIWSADFLPQFLLEVYPELKACGYTFTTVSKSTPKK